MKGYSPGNDQYWSSAWSVLGSCDGTLAPTSSPTFVVLTNVGGCPKEWEANGIHTAGDAYEEGDMVSSGGLVFKCKVSVNILWCLQHIIVYQYFIFPHFKALAVQFSLPPGGI